MSPRIAPVTTGARIVRGPGGGTRRAPDPAAAPPRSVEQLLQLARRRAHVQLPAGDRNFHATNRRAELGAALQSDATWFEVDVRRQAGVSTAAHDRRAAPDALRIDDWVRIVAASGRGMKLDFKERDAIAPTLDLVRRAGVDDARLIINVRVLSADGLDEAQLRRIRRRFPDAVLNLCLGSGSYDVGRLRAAVALARAVGGPVAFPLDLARTTRSVVQALRRGGSVAVWNDPARTPVRDERAVRRDLRDWGVDGMVDLR